MGRPCGATSPHLSPSLSSRACITSPQTDPEPAASRALLPGRRRPFPPSPSSGSGAFASGTRGRVPGAFAFLGPPPPLPPLLFMPARRPPWSLHAPACLPKGVRGSGVRGGVDPLSGLCIGTASMQLPGEDNASRRKLFSLLGGSCAIAGAARRSLMERLTGRSTMARPWTGLLGLSFHMHLMPEPSDGMRGPCAHTPLPGESNGPKCLPNGEPR
jgi:hypothetical protein